MEGNFIGEIDIVMHCIQVINEFHVRCDTIGPNEDNVIYEPFP